MTKQQKNDSIFRKIAGLFYRFPEDEYSRNETENKEKSPPKNDDFNKPQKSDFPFPKKEAQVAAKTGPELNSADHLRGNAQMNEVNELPTAHISKAELKKEAEQQEQSFTSESGLIHCPPIAKRRKYAPIVTFKNVTKVFNKDTENEFMALDNVSFEIEDLPEIGEFIALVGPSGCGKSTVLNLIQGFQEVGPATSGTILVRNKPIKGPGRDRGMIFQKYSSFPHLTVLENVKFGLELNKESLGFSDGTMTHLALQMIKKVGLQGHEDKYPYQLSGGQQQRVAIARTLVLKPRIIFMDEPFSALDEPTRIEMQQLITDLWHEVEATVFIVTHSLAEAIYLSDRIFLFSAAPGRLHKQILIPPEAIGKEPGLSPMEVQEGPRFKKALKEVTEEFLKIGEIE
jgi:NitT/TauT family transport system ATP-binding protein